MRRGLRLLLNLQPNLEICGEAATVPAALQLIPGLRPDIAIVDLSLKDEDGFELIRQLRSDFPRLKILVLSMHGEWFYVSQALQAGAQGYVTKQESTEHIIDAITLLMSGKRYLSHDLGKNEPSRRRPRL